MTYLEYANWVPLPTPVTTGTTVQSFTAPDGEVWVAKNGVNSGNWYRARDVLHCNYFRSAATTIAGQALFIYDGLTSDPYGIYNTSNGIFTALIAGKWRIRAALGATPTASGQYVNVLINTLGVCRANGITHSSSTTWDGCVAETVWVMALNDTGTVTALAGPSVTMNVRVSAAGGETTLLLDYLGTG